jgi:hypothetical protein
MFIASLFTIAEEWKQPRYPFTDEWINLSCTHSETHTHGSNIHPYKQGNPVICNMYKPEGQYANQNKPNRGTNTASSLLYVESEKVELIELESRLWLSGL